MTTYKDYFYDLFKRAVDRQVRLVEKELKFNGTYIDDIEEEEFAEMRLYARSKVIKEAKKACDTIFSIYHRELTYRPEFKYPLQWMLNDQQINEKLERYPLLTDMLNYLFNYNRYLKGEDYNEMVDTTDEITNRKKYVYEDTNGHEQSRDLAVFITDREFYEEISEKLKYSEHSIKKYLRAFCDAGILVKLTNVGKIGYLYADGYYASMPDNKKRKHSFLKNTPEFRVALRNFNPNRAQPKY